MSPNIGKPLRIAYVALGLILLISPLVITLKPWIRIVAPILGILTIMGGVTGL